MKRHLKLSGFTLAELIVVISILAVLATIGFLALSWYSADAKDAAVKSNVRSVYSAINAESALAGNSPRYYVIHDSWAALSWAVVYFDGSPTILTGGAWNVSWTNYSAWNPDYVKLKINPDKFKVSFTEKAIWALAGLLPYSNSSAAFDSKQITVGATDFLASSSGTKKRAFSYFQVAGISSVTKIASVAGNYPWTSISGSVSWLIRDPSSTSSTGALSDGAATKVATTFVLPFTTVAEGGTWSVTNTCSVQPTGYSTSNGLVAAVSWNVVSAVGIGTAVITPIWGNCEDSTPKTITVSAHVCQDGGAPLAYNVKSWLKYFLCKGARSFSIQNGNGKNFVTSTLDTTWWTSSVWNAYPGTTAYASAISYEISNVTTAANASFNATSYHTYTCSNWSCTTSSDWYECVGCNASSAYSGGVVGISLSTLSLDGYSCGGYPSCFQGRWLVDQSTGNEAAWYGFSLWLTGISHANVTSSVPKSLPIASYVYAWRPSSLGVTARAEKVWLEN